MASLTTLSKEDLEDLHSSLWNTYKQEQTKDLHLNMSRGKPSSEQLDLSMELLQFPKSYTLADGTDARNYGVLQGIGECRRLFGDLLDIPAGQIIMGGNASLNLMFDTLAFLLLFGTEGKNRGQMSVHKVARSNSYVRFPDMTVILLSARNSAWK